MKKRIFSLMLALAVLLINLCFAESAVEFEVFEISKYGNAILNITADDFEKLGFEPGDNVMVEADGFLMEMPYLDGFYVFAGEYLLRRSSDGEICLCINYDSFADAAGVQTGDKITISMAEKAGSLALQGTGSLEYTDERSDYASDEIFANFRMIDLGGIADGKIYRSASPIDNDRKRASAANDLMVKAGIRNVMNLADSDAAIAESAAAGDFDSAEYMALYEGGHVIALDMDVNFKAEDFSLKLVKGLNFLAENESPYLIHCKEGKDRAGFASALIAALMGASAEEIALDYMKSYENYYHMDPEGDAQRYNLIQQGNIMEMLRYIAGLSEGESLDDVDLAKAAEEYLLSHGMPEANIEKLKANLSA